MDLKVRRGKEDQDDGNDIEGNEKEEVKVDKPTTLSQLLLGDKHNQGNKIDCEEADLDDEKKTASARIYQGSCIIIISAPKFKYFIYYFFDYILT